MWRARLSYCLLAESLCRVRESESVLLLQAEFWEPVWSESDSVPTLSHQGALCSNVPSIYIVGEPAELRGGVRGVHKGGGESVVPAVEPARRLCRARYSPVLST